MRALKIRLTDFRNIKEAEISFSSGVTVVCGDNAEGKTNLLEAIYFASIGKSFRGQHIGEMLRFGQKEAYLSLDFFGGGREQNISFALSNGRIRQAEKNRVKIRRLSEVVGSFRAVLFSPEHLSLIKDGPAERRQFLDIAISSAEPLYLAALQRYNRILKQRNKLIKDAPKNPDVFDKTVDIWSAQLALEGAMIAKTRKRYVEKAAVYVKECFAEMTGMRETPELIYQGFAGKDAAIYEDNDKTEKMLYDKLVANKDREIAAGATLFGIHKDDLEVTLNGRLARSFCSQGQQRSLALALKIAESELCRLDCGEYPVLLFDDVLSELDSGRRRYLIEKIKDKQVILTTCEKITEEEGLSAASRILVQDGTYTPN